MPTIKIENFSKKEVDKAIGQIKAYKRSLVKKVERLVQRLGEIGIDTIKAEMVSIPDEEAGDDWETRIIMQSKNSATIRLSGSKVLFIEYSAGTRYGTKEYPLPSGEGFGATSYPNQTHASSPYGWWYPTGEVVDNKTVYEHSYGNRAYMPMYKADMAIFMDLKRIAIEVFADGSPL